MSWGVLCSQLCNRPQAWCSGGLLLGIKSVPLVLQSVVSGPAVPRHHLTGLATWNEGLVTGRAEAGGAVPGVWSPGTPQGGGGDEEWGRALCPGDPRGPYP